MSGPEIIVTSQGGKQVILVLPMGYEKWKGLLVPLPTRPM